MDFRNSKCRVYKSTSKTNKVYVKLSEVEGAFQIDDGEMWLRSSKDMAWSPGVSINVDENHEISDWVRKITLRNVELTVEENKRGYPELVISGQSGAQ